MACCLYFSHGSRAWLALLVPIFAVFASVSSVYGAFLIPISFILIFLLTFPKRKPTNSLLKEGPIQDSSCDEVEGDTAAKGKGEEMMMMMGSQDLYSESESMDQCSSSSSEDHSSDMEWPYSMTMAQRVDCSDGSISDEESLIEIAIGKDPRWDINKLSQDFCDRESKFDKDFWAEIYEMNEEDNLIEIDINIGSIKC